jgi:hypothetical protein
VDIDIPGDQLDVLGVLQHQVVEKLQRELGELDGIASQLLDGLALFLVDAAADATGQSPVGMHLDARPSS